MRFGGCQGRIKLRNVAKQRRGFSEAAGAAPQPRHDGRVDRAYVRPLRAQAGRLDRAQAASAALLLDFAARWVSSSTLALRSAGCSRQATSQVDSASPSQRDAVRQSGPFAISR